MGILSLSLSINRARGGQLMGSFIVVRRLTIFFFSLKKKKKVHMTVITWYHFARLGIHTHKHISAYRCAQLDLYC